MVGLQTLDLAIGVRVPASQPHDFNKLRAALLGRPFCEYGWINRDYEDVFEVLLSSRGNSAVARCSLRRSWFSLGFARCCFRAIPNTLPSIHQAD